MSQRTSELYYLTIRQASELLKSGQLSPVELARAFLDRIDQLDGTLQAYITVLPDSAMAQARQAEAEIMRGDYKGPLHGIPIALKDLYDTAGVRTTASSRVLADRVPAEDATATARLKAAGIVLLGKLAMHEFALGGPDFTCGFPVTRNPWNTDYEPGGSSSGSGAGIAAGLCMGSLGSCTGGSIREPAHHCSMVGFKPTYGRVSRYGVLPLSWTLDHCGPMTWTVEDAAIMLQAIAGHDPKDPTSSTAPVPDYSASLREDVKGLKIGVPRHFFFADDPLYTRETLSIVDTALEALEGLGAHVQEVTVPSLDHSQAAEHVIALSEGFAYHQPYLRSRPQDFGEKARSWFLLGGLLFTAADYIQAQRVRGVLKREFAEVLEKVDVIATPTMASPAARFDELDDVSIWGAPTLTGPFNMTGMPAISIPCGFTSAGLPEGLQIAGKPFDEPTVLRAAYTSQQHARWFEKRPPV